MPEEIHAGRLCLECGFCCNGVIFGDVKLQAGDEVVRLRSLGLPVSVKKVQQPCWAWQDCQCQIYADRPKHCRAFECLLFKKLETGEVDFEKALRTVGSTKEKVARVERLLEALGDTPHDPGLNLRARFLKTLKRFETSGAGKEQAGLLSELTRAFHELDQSLRQNFYGPA